MWESLYLLGLWICLIDLLGVCVVLYEGIGSGIVLFDSTVAWSIEGFKGKSSNWSIVLWKEGNDTGNIVIGSSLFWVLKGKQSS